MINIMMAINDSRGNLSGYLDKIEIEDCETFSVEPSIMDDNFHGAAIRFFKNGFIIYGQFFESLLLCEWAGNIMWNEYKMHAIDVVRLFKLLKSKGEYSPDCGYTDFWDWWDNIENQKYLPSILKEA